MKRNKLDMKQQENNDLKKYKNLKRTQKKYSIMAQCLEFVDPNEEKCLPIRVVSGSKLEVFSRHSKKRIKQQFDYNLQCIMQSKKKCKLPNIRTNFDDVKEDQITKINKFYKQDKYNQPLKTDSIREDIFSEIQQQETLKICSLHSDKQSKQNENKQPILQIKCIRKKDTNTALNTAYSQAKNKFFNKQKQQKQQGHKNKFNINTHTQKESFKDRKNKKNSQIKGNSSENNSLNKNKRSITLTLKAVKQPKMSSEYHDFGRLICLLQKLKHSQEPIGSYKAYVGRGNNSILIKNTIKNRFWWTISDNELDSNLQWSQNRDMKILGCLKPLQIISKQQKIYDKSSLQIKQFNMQTSKDNQKNQKTRQYTQIGFYKLLSQQERKNYAYNQFHLEIICNNLSQIRNIENPNKNRMHNHLQFNWHLCNKKALYYNLKAYYKTIKQDPFEYIPLTFHIQQYGDNQWQEFKIAYQNRINQLEDSNRGKKNKNKNKNLWIIKPGQNSNQGCGIQLCQNIIEIQQIIQKKTNKNNSKKRSHIIQKYLNPFLYNKRKFDIRTYILITSLNNNIRAYWYQQGYIRTSSKQYNIKNIKNKMIHLTNDSVQKKSQDYGKYENGNKISFGDFQKYLDLNQNKMDFYTTIYPKMIKLAHDAVKSIHTVIDNKYRQYTFELFGLDFMIDSEFQTWLIEVNNNPCMQLSSPLLARIIPNMIQNTLRIAVDPIFPPPKEYSKIKNISTDLFENNKFTLIFNSQDQSEKYNIVSCQKNLQNIIESDEYQDQHEQQQKQ